MKKILVCVLAIAGAPAALAADLPVKALPVVPVAPVYNWTGWYGGVNAGGNWGTAHSNMSADLVGGGFFSTTCHGSASPCTVNVDDVSNAGRQNIRTSGFTGGLQGGYNWQSGNLLVGAEADFEYFRSAGSSSKTVSLISGRPGSSTVNASMSTDWLFTLRPRIGWVQNNWLLYATGGLAVTQMKASWTWNEAPFKNVESASTSTTKAGWVVGGGAETMLWQNWIVGAEYLYMKFGDVSVHTNPLLALGGGPPPESFNHSMDLQVSVLRARVSRKF